MSLWSRQSIAVKLPATLVLLLLAAFGAMAVASYFVMRQAVVAIAAERLEQAARQMAGVLGNSSRQRLALMQTLMRNAEVRAYLRAPDPSRADAAAAAMRTYLGSAADTGNVELWDPAGRRLLEAGATFAEASGPALEMLTAELQAVDSPVIGKLRHEGGDSVVYAAGGRLADAGSPLGFIVERRRLANAAQSQQTMALLAGLIGGQASIVIGNADGGTWTNLVQPVAAPPIDISSTSGLLDYQRPGMPRTLARAAPVAATPWQVVVEFPRDTVLAPADRLIRGSAVIALVLLTIAAVTGWILSRRLTTPLRQVTEAAEAVAESRPSVHIDFARQDELGRLAESFNTMAEKVEHARAELERRVEMRTAELSAANRELEAFSYSVSHDLRAPVRAIAGFVQILEDDHSDKLEAEGRRALERVKVNARRMGHLIDDLLAFSQIGRTPMVRQRVDMSELAQSVVDDALRTCAPRTIDFRVEPLPPAFCEPSLINQVFVNLVANAVKFTGRRERASITIGARPDGDAATAYFVRDNGAGFDMRHADKLFGVFQRLHKLEDFEGTGVGLAIIDRVITRHGGRVWAEGKVDGGATFYFTLPANS